LPGPCGGQTADGSCDQVNVWEREPGQQPLIATIGGTPVKHSLRSGATCCFGRLRFHSPRSGLTWFAFISNPVSIPISGSEGTVAQNAHGCDSRLPCPDTASHAQSWLGWAQHQSPHHDRKGSPSSISILRISQKTSSMLRNGQKARVGLASPPSSGGRCPDAPMVAPPSPRRTYPKPWSPRISARCLAHPIPQSLVATLSCPLSCICHFIIYRSSRSPP